MSELVPGTTLASGAETSLGTCVSLWNCKAQPHYASLGYPFHNTAAHT